MGQSQLVPHHPSKALVAQDSGSKGRHQISTLLNTTMLGREYQSAALNLPWPARYICAPLAWLEQPWEPPLSTALLPFEMAKQKVREMRVRSLKRWLTMCCDGSVRSDLPWDPETAYSDRYRSTPWPPILLLPSLHLHPPYLISNRPTLPFLCICQHFSWPHFRRQSAVSEAFTFDSWVSWSDWFGVRRRQRAAAVICQVARNTQHATRNLLILHHLCHIPYP